MPRFTISHHTGSKEGDHYDLMLEQDAALRTFRFRIPSFMNAQKAQALKDHRKMYLDYEGEISGGRGHVRIWDTGTYLVDLWSDSRIQIAVAGKQIRTRLRLEQGSVGPSGKEPTWSMKDATFSARKIASSFLREGGLDQAPTAELERLRRALLDEEQKLMAVMDQYTRAATVDWPLLEIDPELRRRLRSHKARWQHPWLAAAKSYADKLEQLGGLLREGRPSPAA